MVYYCVMLYIRDKQPVYIFDRALYTGVICRVVHFSCVGYHTKQVIRFGVSSDALRKEDKKLCAVFVNNIFANYTKPCNKGIPIRTTPELMRNTRDILRLDKLCESGIGILMLVIYWLNELARRDSWNAVRAYDKVYATYEKQLKSMFID